MPEADTSTPPKAPRAFYRPELDLLRFGAFFMIFVFHLPRTHGLLSGAVQTGFCLGLPIFFLLSAYLITELLLREREATGTIHFRAFFLRRALRILPLYLLTIALCVALGWLIPLYRVPPLEVACFLGMVANVYAAHGTGLSPLIVLWSISVEAQFYLLIPAMLGYGRKWALWAASAGAFAASYLTLLLLGRRHVAFETVWFNSFVQFQFFAAGVVLAICFHRRPWAPRPALRSLLLAAGGISILLLGAVLAPLPLATPTLLCACYLLALIGSVSIFTAVLGAPVRPPAALLYLGRISYGLYAFHELAICLTVHVNDWAPRIHPGRVAMLGLRLLAFLLTVALAALSFELFERRILRLKSRFAWIKSGAAA